MAKKPTSKHKKNNTAWLIIGALIITGGIMWVSLRPGQSVTSVAALEQPAIQTLAPEQFQGKAREAYQAAKEVPQVLAKMPCYCGCVKNMGHMNNLYCFSDYHGADCDLCQDIAIDARDWYRSGQSIDDIREKIIAKYSRFAESE